VIVSEWLGASTTVFLMSASVSHTDCFWPGLVRRVKSQRLSTGMLTSLVSNHVVSVTSGELPCTMMSGHDLQ
jgi:hypothetical protein